MDLGLKEYSGIGIAVGFLGMFAGTSLNVPELSILSSGILVLSGVVFYFQLRAWYCQMCGQKHGRVVKPNKCDRCESNRMTKHDPGVGDAVRVKR